MFGQLGAGSDQAHMPGQHIQQLGQFIQLPSAQKRAYRRKVLVAGRGDRLMCLV
jgi:hypothetical protein